MFEGTDGAYLLFVNGKYVSYCGISKRLSETDITDYVIDGENTLDVFVIPFTANSFFEDQDMWRFKRITRDVYLIERPVERIDDYKIETNSRGELTFTALRGECSVSIAGQKKDAKEGIPVHFLCKDVRAWSAETPVLYDLLIESGSEVIGEKVGFRDICVKDGVVLFNGRKIKFKGVCRHDFSGARGCAVSRKDRYPAYMACTGILVTK